MRLFHISDLHIGKRPGRRDMTEELRHILMDIVLGEAYDAYRPDGLIIAGDIYDRSLPSSESVALFDEFLIRAAELSLPLYIISGNHDSDRRISYGRDIFRRSGVHISRPFTGDGSLYIAQAGGVDIVLMPYISLERLRSVYPDEDIPDMTAGMRLVFSRNGLPRRDRPCVIAAHQAVGRFGSEKATVCACCQFGDSDSKTFSRNTNQNTAPVCARAAGTLELIDPDVFEGFAYAALGHFHSPMSPAENVRYCGSPLCYSKSEAARQPHKSLDIIDIEEGSSAAVEHFPLTPLHETRIISDSLSAILSDKHPPSDDYLYITITANDTPDDLPCGKTNSELIGGKFPNYIGIAYEMRSTAQDSVGGAYSAPSFEELLGGFYREMCGGEIDDELLSLACDIFDKCDEDETE